MGKTDDKKGFKVPEKYFERFTGHLMESISTSKDDRHDPLLPRSGGFKIPDAYFEGLHSKIRTKLKEDESKVATLDPWRKYLYLTAASVAIMILLTVAIRLDQSPELTFESLASSDIEDYFERTDIGFSTYEIAEVVPVDNLEVSDILEYRIDNGDIIDYLDDTIDTIEELNLYDYDND
ncbi:MAG: hypothetical protein CR994_01705 [Maribacter sp.]|nr:MAG: hypothetical protein CR994_01705 [Maribacter sp.]